MERYRTLLARSRLSVVSAEPDHDLARTARTIAHSVRVGGRSELEALFGRLLAATSGAAAIAPKALDLFGHATARTAQLRLGDWVIDADDPTVAAWFRQLAEREVLPRLGIRAVRLLACRTADTPAGRATVRALAVILGVEVYGTRQLLYDVHHDEHGFRDSWSCLLVSASELERGRDAATATRANLPWPRVLDLEALPALPLERPVAGWPRRVATPDAMNRILHLIRRDAGAPLPGPSAPICELALPSATPTAYHVAHVLLGGAFVQFYPDGVESPGVAYPVDDAHALRGIITELPPACITR